MVGLYLNPPDNALVLSVDEKTQIQASIAVLRPSCRASLTHKSHPRSQGALGKARVIGVLGISVWGGDWKG